MRIRICLFNNQTYFSYIKDVDNQEQIREEIEEALDGWWKDATYTVLEEKTGNVLVSSLDRVKEQ